MEPASGATLASILTNIGSIVTQALSWAGDVVDFIVANPLIFVFCGVALVGLGIGMVKRMISL